MHEQPVSVLARWGYWQLRQCFTTKPCVVPYLRGTRLKVYPHEGLSGFWYVTYPDYAEMRFMERLLRPGDHFFDIGANAGGIAVFAASLGCRVTAFEPVPATYKQLVENVTLNEHKFSIDARCAAVSDRAGKIRITTELGTCNRRLEPGEELPFVEIDATTIDEASIVGGAPSFIKIDVEGHEESVLEGATRTLMDDSLLALLVETFRSERHESLGLRRLETRLRDADFLPYDFDPHKNELIPLVKPEAGGQNTIYARDLEAVRHRLYERRAI
jgi:FkbM family methyltransferase